MKTAEREMAKNGVTTGRDRPSVTATLTMLWRTFCRDAFGSYRPELHYMRGPGPAWRAKHAGGAAEAPALAGAAPVAA
jgi:hypothetical protein